MDTTLFQTYKGILIPSIDTLNEAGGKAYLRSPKGQLAQYAATCCLGNTYYMDARTQVETVIKLCDSVDLDFVAQCARYSRHKGFLKDMPSLLVAILALKGYEKWEEVFFEVIDNGKLYRNFFQIIRSGVLGKKSLGYRIKRVLKQWLDTARERRLVNAYLGDQPPLEQIIKTIHVKGDALHQAFYKWVLKKPLDVKTLPNSLKYYELFKSIMKDCPEMNVDLMPDVPFLMMTHLPLSKAQWVNMAKRVSWQTLRMNLNTFNRHNVFETMEMVRLVANRLRDRNEIKRARVYPYQLLMAYKMSEGLPLEIREALQDALEVAVENVPEMSGNIAVCVDVSGSMDNPITGQRRRSTQVKCVEVASLIAAAILRRNPHATLIPFEHSVRSYSLNIRDSVMTNANALARLCGGGTNCSAPLELICRKEHVAKSTDLIIMISDNESWVDSRWNKGTEVMRYWNHIKSLNPKAKFICIDLTPNKSTQAVERSDIFNIGGFSDYVFDLIAGIQKGETEENYFVKMIEQYQREHKKSVVMETVEEFEIGS